MQANLVLVILAAVAAAVATILGFGWFGWNAENYGGWLAIAVFLYLAAVVVGRWHARTSTPG